MPRIAKRWRRWNRLRGARVSFQDEEGRFGGLTGSAIWAGLIEPAAADRLTDAEGTTLAAARTRVGEIAPVRAVPPRLISAYLEAHIEQGPVLDVAGEVLGVVEAIVGVRSLLLTFTGEANHAGTRPMRLRRDAVQGLVAFAAAIEDAFAPLATERTVWTLGRIVVDPNVPSIVPAIATASLQIRDPDVARLDRMEAEALALAGRVAGVRRLELGASRGFTASPVPMDGRMAEALAAAAVDAAPAGWRRMPSGALHDASNVAAVLPVGMLFVPSIGGVSHNPAEDTRREHLAMGLAALARAVARLA